MKRKSEKNSLKLVLCIFVVIIIGAFAGYFSTNNTPLDNKIPVYDSDYEKSAEEIIVEYTKDSSLSIADYPQSLIDLLDRNKETKDFVLSYPEEKGKRHKVNMKEYKNCDSVPLFMQWDKRWGYKQYGDDVAGLTACGPVCLSMVSVYLLQDTKYSPDYMIDWAIDNGYCIEGGGSLWTLISEGGERLGLDVTELPLDKNRIIKNLEVGNPIICVMGPGDFTTKGHFIVMTGYENGKIKINDPNSCKNSEKEWEYDDIYKQIKNLWAIRIL